MLPYIIVGIILVGLVLLSRLQPEGDYSVTVTTVTVHFLDGTTLDEIFESDWEDAGYMGDDSYWLSSVKRANYYVDSLKESNFIKLPDGSYKNISAVTKITLDTKEKVNV